MLGIALLESPEKALGRVGCCRDTQMIQIAKHIGTCIDQHAAGALEIAFDPSLFGGLHHLLTMTLFTLLPLRDETIAAGRRSNGESGGILTSEFSPSPSGNRMAVAL